MRNIALILMYNGTAYHGWQVQKTEVTVAQTLERGLSMVCGEPIKCTGCGRTPSAWRRCPQPVRNRGQPRCFRP